ncbi:testis-specific ATPase inhibitor-like protein [Aphomia sociella]
MARPYFLGRKENKNHTQNTEYRLRVHRRDYTIPGTPGSGAGKGGGAGGTVRESGGGLGQFGAAQEEGYFFNKQREQLEKIKRKMKKEPHGTPNVSQKEEK